MNEIIATLILITALAVIPPLFFADGNHISYLDCLKGWIFLLIALALLAFCVISIMWSFVVLFGAKS